ncbi:hypothetical protein [Labedella gwakjiensis]|uniref:DUF222 domain-containing protein n=2 Tax=Labedella gwakjiensis TaxID=390269 RepID=A0ABY0C7H1_9MICO|nr:hypothetical protein [Labedella gwakjiensis]RUQ85976.1 hypothetical protein ELQ93_02865 [Labedella gwakjiensis]
MTASMEDGPSVSDFAGALSLALSDVMAVRRAALAAGQAATVLRAAATTERLVSTILTTMGVDDEEVVRQLRDGERLALAVGQTARRNPEFAAALRDRLTAEGEHEMAGAMAVLAITPRTHTQEEN